MNCNPPSATPHDEPWLPPQRQRQLIWLLLGLGVLARTVRYLLRFPLWPDEGYLATNFLDRGYLGLMQRLDQDQVCPLLFLWTELSFVKLFGFTEYSLRLFPFLCGIGSLLVFRHVAGRLLDRTAQVLAVGIFAGAYPLIRYSAETKPYMTDVLVSLVLIALFVEWWQAASAEDTGRQAARATRALAALVAFTPIALGFSYPAVFVAGGISLAMAAVLLARVKGDSPIFVDTKIGTVPENGTVPLQGAKDVVWPILSWGLFNAAVGASFLLWLAVLARNQSGDTLSNMRLAWKDTFPPLDSLRGLAAWLFRAHTGDMVGYPIGEVGILTAVGCAVALGLLFRRRQFPLVLLCIAPLALNLIAAGLRRYPYGGFVRFTLYAAPLVCLLAGLGIAKLLTLNPRDSAARRRAIVNVAVSLLAIVSLSSMVRDFLHPYKTAEFQRERDFARWFWTSKAEDGELVCLSNDLSPTFAPRPMLGYGTSLYFCNQQIYSPRRVRRDPPRLDCVSPQWPLRCVRLIADGMPDDALFDQWLADMQTRYVLTATENHRIVTRSRGEEILYCNWVRLYEFAPKSPGAANRLSTLPLEPLRR